MNGPDRMQAPEAWRGPLAEFQAYLEALGYSDETISSRRQHMRMLAEQCGVSPEQVTQADLLKRLRRCKSRAYKKGTLNSFRLFFKWFSQTAHGRTDNPCDGIPSVRKPSPKPKPCPDEAIYAAIEQATALERAALLLAAECGLRRSEIAQVHSRDVVCDSSGHRSLVVVGKGDKQRIVPLPDDLADFVERADGYVLPGRFGGHVNPSWVSQHVGRLLPRGYSAHKLRHRFATTSYAQSHDLLAVSKALGHSSTETTMNYTALPDEALRPLVDAATMTEQAEPAPAPVQPEPSGAARAPRLAAAGKTEPPKRHANGKIHYSYENGHGERRKAPKRTAANSTETIRAAMMLADCLAADLKYKNRRSFSTRAEAFAERFSIQADGHARRSSVVRAGARLLQSDGLVELASGAAGEVCGNVTADFMALMQARNRYADAVAS